MRDKTREGILSASAGVEGLSKGYEELAKAIRVTETEMEVSNLTAKGAKQTEAAFASTQQKIEDGFTMLNEAAKINQAEVGKLTEKFKELGAVAGGAYAKEAGGGGYRTPEQQDIEAQIKVYQSVQKEIDQTGKKLEEQNKILGDAQDKYNNAAAAQVSFRTQLMNVKNGMIELERAGKTNTEEYARLSEKAEQLGKSMNAVNQQVKTLTSTKGMALQGIVSGLSAVAAAASVAQGAIGLFSDKNEELQQIMLKVQSLMSVTIGLQQLSATFNKESALYITVLSKAQNAYSASMAASRAAAATGAVANVGLAASFRAIGAAISAIPVFGWILAAISGLIALYQLFTSRSREAQKATEEFYKSVADNAFKPITEINKLSAEWTKLADNLDAKETFVRNNKKAFDELGISVRTVADAEMLLIQQKDAFVNAQIAKAKAMALTESKAYKDVQDKAVETQLKLEEEIKAWEKMSGKKVVFSEKDPKTQRTRMKQGNRYMYDLNEEMQNADEKLKKWQNQSLEYWDEYNAELSKAGKKTGETIKGSVGEQIQILENRIANNKAAYDELSKDDREGQKKALAQRKAYEQELNHLQGKENNDKKSDRSGESAVEKARRKAQEQADANQKLINGEVKSGLDRLSVDYDLQQKLLDIEKDGFDKRLNQLSLNYQKELLAVDKHEQELIEKQQEIERQQWEKDGKKGVFMPATTDRGQLPKDQQDELANMRSVAAKAYMKGNESLLEELLKQYQTYADRRKDVEEKFNADLTTLQKANTSGQYNDAVAELEKQRKKAIQTINNEEADEAKKASNLFVRLFTDASGQSVKEIRRVIDETQALYDYLSTTKEEDITANFGFTAEQLKDFKGDAEQLKAILDGLISKKKELAEKSEFEAFSQSIGDAIKKINKGGKDNIGEGIADIGAAAQKMMPAVEKFGQDLGSIFGSQTADDIKVITDLLGATVEVGTGVGKIMSGDVIGGIQDVVSGLSKIFSMASAAEQRHQKALEEIAQRKLSMQREYNLLLLEQNLLLKEATTIFGEKQIEKAANALKVYQDAFSQFSKELKGDAPAKLAGFLGVLFNNAYKKQLDAYNQGVGALNQIMIKTGHEKTGLFGWGSGRDIYSSLLDVYGKDKLLNPDGSLNIDFAKTILDTQTLSDKNKELLQSLVDLQEKATEAQDALRNYLQDTFGSLGGDLMDSITSSIQDKGVNAWEAFGDAGAKVIENLGKQLAYELFFAGKFEQLQKDLEAVYGNTVDPEEIARKQMELVGDFYNTISGDMEAAQAFMENWQKQAEEYGFDLWQGDGTSQSGQSGAFTTMSQEQGTKLEGLFTSVQMHTANIDEMVTSMSSSMYEALDTLTRISENTEFCRFLEDIKDDIAMIKRDGLKVK
jgi:hypothetical protein